MPRTSVTSRKMVANGTLAGATGPTTIDSTLVTNGVTVPNAKPERTVLRVANTAGSALDCIVRAGDSPPALLAGNGDYTEEIAATSGIEYLGPFTSGRFLQSDGALHIDFETGFTGTIDVLEMPRSA